MKEEQYEYSYNTKGSNSKPEGRRKALLAVVVISMFLQLLVFLFQVHELYRYDEEISHYMPDMSCPDRSNAVQAFFNIGVIKFPFWVQFILVPAAIVSALLLVKNPWNSAFIAIAVVVFALMSWAASLMGTVYSAGSFD